jgi:subfamily B ATP-binding cassette protein MsbA
MYVALNGLINQHEVTFKNLPHIPYLKELTFPLVFLPIFLGGVFLMRSVFNFISEYLVTVVGLKAVRNIRNDIYSHLNYLSLDFFSKGRTGDLMSRTINDVTHIQGAVTDVLVDLVKSPAVICFNIPMVFILGGKLGLIAVLAFPFIAIPVAILGRKVRKFTKRSQESSADIASVMHEAITGIRVVKAFNQEEAEIKRFTVFNNNVFKYLKRQAFATIVQSPVIEALGGIAAAVGIWIGIHYLPPDRFVGYLTTLYVFYEPIKKLSRVNSAVQRAVACGNRIFEIIDTPPSVKDEGKEALEGKIRDVRFTNLEFHYDKPDDEGEQFTLQNIDFSVRSGDVVALVGSSGSGKSSLVNLIPRFYDVTRGSTHINGRDIRSYTLKSLRSQIGVVSQEVVLFNDTVANNISYGSPHASHEEIIEAAKAAHAHEFIMRLEKDYETVVGEKGVQLSGGQRQRLTIARAILKNPPILVLDEATSSLDTESEREVQKAIDELMVGRTVFVIAHRLSTVQHASRILVLDRGKIIQDGTSEKLLLEGGVYRRLYELQFNI